MDDRLDRRHELYVVALLCAMLREDVHRHPNATGSNRNSRLRQIIRQELLGVLKLIGNDPVAVL